jgi:quercetin dioxygenase-like cupin family protein
MRSIHRLRLIAIILGVCLTSSAPAQQAASRPGISSTPVTRQTLPPGNFRNVTATVVELAPGAVAGIHRHDVAVLAYVLEGEVENRLNGGAPVLTRTGESWWEAPGTIHNVARNPSLTARARFLVVYVGEEGKPNSAPVDTTRPR